MVYGVLVLVLVLVSATAATPFVFHENVMRQVSGNIMLVSGNILSSAENEERIRCHFQGKQYLGWKACRDKFKELKEKFANRPSVTRY